MLSEDWLRARSAATPAATALLIGAQQWTYQQLDRLVDRLCTYLTLQGISAGDMTAALLPGGLDAVCLAHALARLGAIMVPLNSRLTTHELGWQLAHTRAKWLIGSPETAATIAELGRGAQTGLILDEKWSHSPPIPRAPRAWSATQIQTVIFTSGTTGRPKGTMITYGNHFYSAMSSAYRLGLDPQDIWLSSLPLYHVGGLAVIFRSCLYGTAVDLHPRFDMTDIQLSFQTKPISLISLVPTMLLRLLDALPATAWPPTLRLLLLGGAAAAPELLQRAFAAGLPVAPTYGLTEAASQVATITPTRAREKPGSVGKPLLFTHARIADRQGQTVPAGVYGEICVSGPTVMAGYLHDPAATAAALSDGELRSGDIGYLDDAGDLWLVQRRSDVIISGGENVYPAEVEQALRAHPGVLQACVVGIADREWGQKVAALVVAHPETAVSSAALRDFCRERLADYKIPQLVRFVPALPHTASGKVHRRRVVDMLEKDGA